METNYCRIAFMTTALGWLLVAGLRAEEAVPLSTGAPAKSDLMKFFEQDYLFGDWGGLRTKLSKEHGVDFEFFYIASNPYNLDGGKQTGSTYEGALMLLLDLDSAKLAGYDGGHLHVSGTWMNGNYPFSDKYVGDLNKVNLIDFPDVWRLWELWYEQKFFGDKVSLKFGQMAVDQDFLVTEYYNSLASINLLNQTFFYPTLAFNVYDIPGFPPGYHALASSPYGAPGARLKVEATEDIYVQVAAYDGYPDQNNGTEFQLSSQEGALVYFELGYRLNQGKEDTGLPGNFKLGGYYHTDDFYDMYEGTFAALDNYLTSIGQPALGVYPNPKTHNGTYGMYFLAEQMLYREVGKEDPAQQGLVGFFRLTGAPPDRNLTQFGVDGGLVYKGLIPTRDYDSIALAASYLKMSDDLAHAQEDINAIFAGFALPPAFPDTADYEAVVELSYKAQMTAWWTMHVDVQRAIHPGGSAAVPDAWVFILASTLRF
jgi:porin